MLAPRLFPLPRRRCRSALAHRTRYFALALVTKPLNVTTASTLAFLRKATDDLEMNYNATVYGDATQGTEETLTTNEAHDSILFGSVCLRDDAAKCLAPAHPWYPYTNFGLDTLMRKYLEELRMLMLEPESTHTVNNTHFNFIWSVGKGDLHEGLQQLLTLCEDDTLTDSEEAKTLQIAMLVVAFCMNVFFFLRVREALLGISNAAATLFLPPPPPPFVLLLRLKKPCSHFP